MKRMISVGPIQQNSNMTASIEDLVPANLAKARGDTVPEISAKYTKVGESIRRNAPQEVRCSMFCGGRRCKYESSSSWKNSEVAIPGIYSHWITDDLLAMARPNTQNMAKHDTVEQFKNLGIKSIINLQTPGEHASCGPNLHESGFTYDPADFMKADIFFYNFAWKDYGEASMVGLLDMVKVLSFALSEGKVAVHCHAGLGRTGVLVAAYLVYYLRVRSNDALRYVRLKRPGAVQTRKQIDCVKEFEAYFLPQCLVFSLKPIGDTDKKQGRFSVETALKRQRYVVHGFEARGLKHIPKLIFKICERLLKLSNAKYYSEDMESFTKSFLSYKFDAKGGKMSAGKYKSVKQGNARNEGGNLVTRRSSNSMLSFGSELNSLNSSGMPTPSSGTRPGSQTNSYVQSCASTMSGVDDRKLDDILADGIQNQTIQENVVTKELQEQTDYEKQKALESTPICDSSQVYEALMLPFADLLASDETSRDIFNTYKFNLNNRGAAWNKLDTETDIGVLSALLFEWLEHLKSPILDRNGITFVVIHCDDVEAALQRLPSHVCYILEYLVRFVSRLKLKTEEENKALCMRIVAALTHQSVTINGVNFPDAKLGFPKLRGGTSDSTLKFMLKLREAIEQLPKDQAVHEFRQKFTAMEVDHNASSGDANSMKVQHSATSRQTNNQNLDESL